jgi:FecR-like protein
MTKRPEEPLEPERPDDPVARLIRLAGPRESAPAERAARVRDAVHARWRDTVLRERRRRTLLRTARIAAGLLLALGTVLWLKGRIPTAGAPAASIIRVNGRVLANGHPIDATGGGLSAGAEIATGPDGRVALGLQGGPSVRLDTDTEVRLVSAGVVEMRRGALYVDTGSHVAAGPAAAPGAGTVRILTDLGRVRDVGTQFEVRLAGGALHVSVRDGVATLERDDRSYSARAGTRLRVDARGAVETSTVALRGADWDWVLAVAPPFDLEGRTLRDYLDWLSRETGWTVTYADSSIGSDAATITLHGSTSGLRPDQTPAVVLPTCGLDHRLVGETLVIERPAGGGDPR